ncbi:SGNH/GDSL hydrolase family protein [Spirosoma areae]
MNVLVVGDEHTYGYGLPGGKLSYIGHFIRQISRSGQGVSVDAYAHQTMPQVLTTLAKLPIEQYDLILLQLDYTAIQPPEPVKPAGSNNISLPCLPGVFPKADHTIGASPASLIAATMRFMLSPTGVGTGLSALLTQVRPYRHKVLLLTPFPHREPIRRWVNKHSRAVIVQEANDQLVSVFDTDSVIRPRDEYFLTNDAKHLNAISHELLGRSLFDFYESAPTIVTVQAIRRG